MTALGFICFVILLVTGSAVVTGLGIVLAVLPDPELAARCRQLEHEKRALERELAERPLVAAVLDVPDGSLVFDDVPYATLRMN